MPLIANNNNKESFRLLDLSSDVSSEDLHLDVAPVKKKRIHRKNRTRGVARAPDIPSARQSPWQRTLRIAGWVMVFSWLIVLTLVLCTINQRLEGIDARFQILSTSSDGVSDAIQSCHSAAKELRANTSSLAERLGRLSRDHDLLVANFTETAAQLAKLQEKLSKMPDLINTPVRLDDLTKHVTDMGSKLNGIDDTIKTDRKGLEELKIAVNETSIRLNVTSGERKEASEQLRRLNQGVRALNKTISARLNNTERQLLEYASQVSQNSALLKDIQIHLASLTPAPASTPAVTSASTVKQESARTVPPVLVTQPPPAPAATAPNIITSAPAVVTPPSDVTKGKLESAV